MKDLPLFYAPPRLLADPARIQLPPEEAVHATRVMRRRVGDQIQVVDGEGHWYRVRLLEAAKDRVVGTTLERRVEVNEPAVEMCIGLALLKSRHRFETFLEKAVELGVTTILPLQTEHTQGRSLRAGRAHQVLVAALKQCQRCRLPRLLPCAPVSSVLNARRDEQRFIAYASADVDLVPLLSQRPLRSVCVLVGPEGGFSAGERAQAKARGFTVVRFGPRRLRSETAAIVAASAVMMHAPGTRR